MNDIFGEGGIDLGDIFGGAFGGRGRRPRSGQHRARKGEDLTVDVTVPFMLAANGGEYDLHLNRDGTPETLAVKIPAGIRDGAAIRLAGQGSPGAGGGPAGDLRINVSVAAHPYFRREGDDLYVELPLNLVEAALGAKVDVPTLTDGFVTLSIPKGTSSGAKLRLKGKGFKDPKSGQQGDQFAVVKIVMPKHPSAKVAELIEQLRTEITDRPREKLW
ncbi:MAG: J domain-containing protein [Planctomycetaceae bacterium]